ncbi:MAG TPA: competence/damage-inducible protein A [Paludibacteraceae bacterium]|nr:competence/damage-inducible protein A [Paludibacteraceae bacterium]HRS67860.1 competence/damage-inducible protein A [Paludibacteraceae bacterium]
MNACLINIGDELLIGQVVNTNASWIAAELEKNNIHVAHIVTISDDFNDITQTLTEALARAEIVIITGGLGPTKDDITKTALCDYFGMQLVMHEPSLTNVVDYFTARGLQVSAVNQKQGLVPDGCEPLVNKVGTAPGMWFERDGKVVVSLPGVPFEMQWLMHEYVLPKLQQRLGTEAILHKTVLTCGIGESFLADIIEEWEMALPDNFRLAYLPEAGKVRLRLSAHGEDKALLQRQMNEQIAKLVPFIDTYIYGYDDDTFATVVGKLLIERSETIATAESCSGGHLGHRITEVAGASTYYLGGVIAYANHIKEELLGVHKDTLEHYGAVSAQTAEEMAKGCRRLFQTDYAIATTGISGPTGGTDEKPLGTVWIAIASKNEVISKKYLFRTTRTQHQERTVNQALFDFWYYLTHL